MSRVFISSTFSDLREHRQTLSMALRKGGHHVIEMEAFAARDERPLDYCLSKVADADVLVCMVAWRFGFPARDEKSITQLEDEHARHLKKRCFAFLLDDKHPWLPSLCDEGAQPRPIDLFRARLSTELVCDFFTTPNDLATRVVVALSRDERQGRADSPQRTATTALTRRGNDNQFGRLPGPLIAGTLGRLQYWRSADNRQALREVFRESALQRRLFPEMNVAYRPRGGEGETSEKLITIVTGPAGVGKTSYASQLIAKLDSAMDIPIVLRGGKLAESGTVDPLNVCREIRSYFDDTLSLERDTRIPLAAVSHALNRRRVLIVIEDLHHAGVAQDVLIAVRTYMEKYHRWGSHLRILATTREAGAPIRQQLGEQAKVVALQPFTQADAQRFFFDLAVANGLMPDTLTFHGEALSRAFTTEGVRTPLFVVICAWLVSPIGGGVDIAGVLSMTASEVFDTFIGHLFRRSEAPADEYREFRDFYERLALSLWPQWEDCRFDVVEEQCRVLGAGKATASVEFMQRNGFLITSRFHGLRLQFPHQSMADYLTACALVKHRRWSDLSRETILGRVEGLVPFLTELIRDEETLLALAPANFGVFLGVVDARARRGEPLPFRRLIGALHDYARAAIHQPPLPESFTRIHSHVAGRIADPWVQDFAAVLGTLPTTSEVIATLAAIGSEADETFKALLLRRGTRQAFVSAASRPAVRNVLKGWLSNPSLTIWRAVTQVLLGCEGTEGVNAVRASLADRLGGLQLEDISMLRQSSVGTQLLAEAAADGSLASKQRIAALCVESEGRALIPRGLYDVQIEGKRRQVKINHSFIVPAVAQTLPGTFTVSADILQALRRQLGDAPIMTEHQARVVHAHFGFSSGRHGVMFAAPGEDVVEVFRTSAREIGLFVIPSSSRALQSFSKPVPKPSTRETVRYRGIELLERKER